MVTQQLLFCLLPDTLLRVGFGSSSVGYMPFVALAQYVRFVVSIMLNHSVDWQLRVSAVRMQM